MDFVGFAWVGYSVLGYTNQCVHTYIQQQSASKCPVCLELVDVHVHGEHVRVLVVNNVKAARPAAHIAGIREHIDPVHHRGLHDSQVVEAPSFSIAYTAAASDRHAGMPLAILAVVLFVRRHRTMINVIIWGVAAGGRTR